MPLIGGKLWSYQPGTSTPKATFADPFFTIPNPNCTLLDDQGKATIFLDGPYKLRLTDPDDVLVWEVDFYEFSSGVQPSGGLVQWGSSEATLTALDGASVLRGEGLVPSGYRLIGLTTTITEDFGTSRGLTGLLLGDQVLADRWGLQTTLVAGTQTHERAWHSDTQLVTAQPYTFLLSPRGGLFDANGALHVTATWQVVSTEMIPTAGTPITYGSAEATLTATDGAAQLTASGLVPADARLVGLTTEITSSFGTSRGLTGLLLGDAVLADRWGIQTTLTASTESGQQFYHSDTQLIAFPAYTFLVAAQGGLFDANGALHVTLYWQTVPADTP
jgi:hypothetical protein